MSEGLFILTTIFVAYVVYAAVSDQKTTAKPKAAPTAKPEAQAAVAEEKPAVIKSAPTKATVTKTASPNATAKPAVTKATTTKAAKKTTAVATKSAGLKDPKTGEVAATYGNYRFTKRWLKEALVAEGLLEKVYTNNELNAETEANIKEAIAKLEAMDKYKA